MRRICFCLRYASLLFSLISYALQATYSDEHNTLEKITLSSLPKEIYEKIIEDLSLQDVISLGETSQNLRNYTETDKIWYPLYQREKQRLFPFLKGEILFDTLPRSLITSYKQVLRFLTILQQPFLKEEPSYALLLHRTEKAFEKSCLYRPLLSYMISSLQQDVSAQRRYGFKLLSVSSELSRFIYDGIGLFKTWSKTERLEALKKLENSEDCLTESYILTGISSGNLDDRSTKERGQELYQRAEQGKNLFFVADSLKKGSLLGEKYTYEESLQHLEGLIQKSKNPAFEHVVEEAIADLLYKPISFSSLPLTDQKRFDRLKMHALKGNSKACSYLFECLRDGHLGTNAWLEEARFDLLKSICELEIKAGRYFSGGDDIARIILEGDLGQHQFSLEQRLKVLQEMAFLENEQTKRLSFHGIGVFLINFIGEKAIENSLDERIALIEDLADKGLKSAQRSLVNFILEGSFTHFVHQTNPIFFLSAEERFKYLKKYHNKGYEGATKALIDVLYRGQLDQGQRSLDERYRKIKKYHNKGNKEATEVLIEALYKGHLGQDQRLPDERYRKLQKYAMSYEKAQEYLNKVEEEGGFKKESSKRSNPFMRLLGLENNTDIVSDSIDRFIKKSFEQKADFPLSPALLLSILEQRAEKGDREAQEWIYQAIYMGKYKYQVFSPLERYNLLLERAYKGEDKSIRWLVRSLELGELDQHKNSFEECFAQLKYWSLKQDKTAQQALIKILRKKERSSELENAFELYKELMSYHILEAGEEVCQRLINGHQLSLTKAERLDQLIKLNEEGYEAAQKALTDLLLPFYPNGPWFNDALQTEDLGSLEKRIMTLSQHGNQNNSYARLRIHNHFHHYLQGLNLPPIHHTSKIITENILQILRWYAQEDIDCKLYCSQGSKKIEEFEILLSHQSFYPLFEIIINPSQDRLNQIFRTLIYEIQGIY